MRGLLLLLEEIVGLLRRILVELEAIHEHDEHADSWLHGDG